ncbi:MAG TPA: sigma-54-dependent Fis family transcriptional regulator [Deltaproteobacteria bacterium]|nr:sigma-54-dependent Fis family transcriptional regulator [Deltaproteobacteria bacterium]
MPKRQSKIIGKSPQIVKIRELINQVAGTNLNVLICGESGVGKELVAQELYLRSPRAKKPFVKINCAAIPRELLESELFGYSKGAFTGANQDKPGKFEMANQGVLFLDEIGDMPLELQAKLLQVLQDGQFSRLGSPRDLKVDTWIMAATNQDLEENIRKGTFREDLYYRLNIIKIYIPPLRERKEDINLLINYFYKEFRKEYPKTRFQLTREIRSYLEEYPWPGNVRELRNVVQRLVILRDWQTLKAELEMRRQEGVREYKKETPAEQPAPKKDTEETDQEELGVFLPLKEVKRRAIEEAERKAILSVLHKTNWNRRKAAEILQISYKALLYKIKQHQITSS